MSRNPLCKTCRQPFERRLPLQSVCGLDCAKSLALSVRLKEEKRQAVKEKREDRARKEKLKTRGEWIADVQVVFNRYVRLRDISAGHGCIDCGKPFEPHKFGGSADAGHYLSRGAAPHLRFDERNVFAQRKNCNRPGGTTREAFRNGVIARIGLQAIQDLESDQSSPHWTVEDLKAMKKLYAAKARELEKARE